MHLSCTATLALMHPNPGTLQGGRGAAPGKPDAASGGAWLPPRLVLAHAAPALGRGDAERHGAGQAVKRCQLLLRLPPSWCCKPALYTTSDAAPGTPRCFLRICYLGCTVLRCHPALRALCAAVMPPLVASHLISCTCHTVNLSTMRCLIVYHAHSVCTCRQPPCKLVCSLASPQWQWKAGGHRKQDGVETAPIMLLGNPAMGCCMCLACS